MLDKRMVFEIYRLKDTGFSERWTKPLTRRENRPPEPQVLLKL
jgi:hypothetical protein